MLVEKLRFCGLKWEFFKITQVHGYNSIFSCSLYLSEDFAQACLVLHVLFPPSAKSSSSEILLTSLTWPYKTYVIISLTNN